MKNFLAILFFLLLKMSILAQNDYNDVWFLYIGDQKISDRWNLSTEAHFYNKEPTGNLRQTVFRAGLGYNLTESNHNLLLGYGQITTYAIDEQENRYKQRVEDRIYQQFVYKHSLGKTELNHRIRLEERFFTDDDFQLRGRYSFGVKIPLSKAGVKVGKPFVSTSGELLIIPENTILDRFRLYIGMGIMLTKNTRFELGYMNQTQVKKSGNIFSEYQNQSQVQIGIYNTIDFRRKK